jgi:hypothetical protein
LMRARLRRAGMACNDQIYGLGHSGAMNEARLLEVLAALPPGVSEIYLHPATLSGSAISASMAQYRHGAELQALLSPAVRSALEDPSLMLGGYGDIAAFRAGAAT